MVFNQKIFNFIKSAMLHDLNIKYLCRIQHPLIAGISNVIFYEREKPKFKNVYIHTDR